MSHRRLLTLLLLCALAPACKEPLTIRIKGKGLVKTNDGEVDCQVPECTYELKSGSMLDLHVESDADFTFDGWGGACAGKEKKCALTLEEASTVEAKFVRHASLAVTLEGAGRVYGSKGELDCPGKCATTVPAGTEIKLVAKDTKSSFDGWGGDCTGDKNQRECKVVVKGKKGVQATARFRLPPGEVTGAMLAGSVDIRRPRVGVAWGEEGGFAVASVVGRQSVGIARFDAEGKEVYRVQHAFAGLKIDQPPTVTFFGSDLLMSLGGKKTKVKRKKKKDAPEGLEEPPPIEDRCVVTRVSADGKLLRWQRELDACTALPHLAVEGDSVFAAGTFVQEMELGDSRLSAAGDEDVFALRIGLDEGFVTWGAQQGGKKRDRLVDFVVDETETGHMAWIGAGSKDGSWFTKINPAGKPYPAIRFGDSGRTFVRQLTLVEDMVHVVGEIEGSVKFGANLLRSRQRGRQTVFVVYDREYKDDSSRIVASTLCPAGFTCAVDARGGMIKVTDRRGRLSISRLNQEGTERWSNNLRYEGVATAVAAFVPNTGSHALLALSLKGDVKLAEGKTLESADPALAVLLIEDGR